MSSHSNYMQYAYFEGSIVPFEDAKVSVATNALQYGIGLFGGIKGYYSKERNGVNIFRLDDHIQRLINSSKILRFKKDWDKDLIKDSFIKLTEKNSPKTDVYYRPFIYRSDIGLSPELVGDYQITIYMLPLGDYFDKSRGLSAQISSWIRNSDLSIPPRTKASGGYINSALATDSAKSAGYDCAIMLDNQGHVSEGAVMNIYMVREGKIITTGVTGDILEGVTRKTVLEIAAELEIPVEQRAIDRTELYVADEVFFSGTATEISWCEKVDNIQISHKKGKITGMIEEQFKKKTMEIGELVQY